jgi:hypothetical protein
MKAAAEILYLPIAMVIVWVILYLTTGDDDAAP